MNSKVQQNMSHCGILFTYESIKIIWYQIFQEEKYFVGYFFKYYFMSQEMNSDILYPTKFSDFFMFFCGFSVDIIFSVLKMPSEGEYRVNNSKALIN